MRFNSYLAVLLGESRVDGKGGMREVRSPLAAHALVCLLRPPDNK